MFLYGKTQNANKSLNKAIWNKIPEPCYAGPQNPELGVCNDIAI